MSNLQIGLVGLRSNGIYHIENSIKIEGLNITAVSDIDSSRLDSTADKYNIKYKFTNADDLFNQPFLDGVILSVPNHLHADLSIKALNAGKHVLVEKPAARTCKEVLLMMDAQRSTGKILMTGMNMRLKPIVYSIKRMLNSNIIGKIYSIDTKWIRPRLDPINWQRGDWFLNKSLSGGGPLMDLGVHTLDLAMHYLDFPEVKSVTGICYKGIGEKIAKKIGKYYECEDSAAAIIRFANNLSIKLEVSFFNNAYTETLNDFRISAENGSVINNHIYNSDDSSTNEISMVIDETAPKNSVEHFYNVLTGKERLNPEPLQALKVMEIIEAIYLSSDNGKTIYFDQESKNEKI